MKAVIASIVYHVAAFAALCVGGLVGWLELVGCLLGVACVCTRAADKNN